MPCVWDQALASVPVIQQDVWPPDERVWEANRVDAGITARIPLQIVVAPILRHRNTMLGNIHQLKCERGSENNHILGEPLLQK